MHLIATREQNQPHFWIVFNTEGSFKVLKDYLGQGPTFDELLIKLF